MFFIVKSFFILVWAQNLSHKKKPRKNKEEINKEFLETMVEREIIENDGLKQITENVVRLGDAVTCVKECGKLIRSKKTKYDRSPLRIEKVTYLTDSKNQKNSLTC